MRKDENWTVVGFGLGDAAGGDHGVEQHCMAYQGAGRFAVEGKATQWRGRKFQMNGEKKEIGGGIVLGQVQEPQ